MGFLENMLSGMIKESTGYDTRRLVRRIGGGKLLLAGGAALAGALIAEQVSKRSGAGAAAAAAPAAAADAAATAGRDPGASPASPAADGRRPCAVRGAGTAAAALCRRADDGCRGARGR